MSEQVSPREIAALSKLDASFVAVYLRSNFQIPSPWSRS